MRDIHKLQRFSNDHIEILIEVISNINTLFVVNWLHYFISNNYSSLSHCHYKVFSPILNIVDERHTLATTMFYKLH